MSRGNFNEPGQVQVVVIIFRESRWCDDSTWNTVTVSANIFIDIHTTVSSIIIAVSIVGLIITDAISNFRKSKPRGAVFLMITNTIRAVILVDVDTAISTIVEATRIVCLIIADPISNQCDISSTIWNINAIQCWNWYCDGSYFDTSNISNCYVFNSNSRKKPIDILVQYNLLLGVYSNSNPVPVTEPSVWNSIKTMLVCE